MPDKPLHRKPVEQPAVVHEVVVPDEAPVRVLMESVPIQDDLTDRSGEVFPQQEPKQVAAIRDWFCRWKWDQTIDVGKNDFFLQTYANIEAIALAVLAKESKTTGALPERSVQDL